MPIETEPTRTLESLSMERPLVIGDVIELDGPKGGELWRVDLSSFGWYLHRPKAICDSHHVLNSLPTMDALIRAILEWSKGYS